MTDTSKEFYVTMLALTEGPIKVKGRLGHESDNLLIYSDYGSATLTVCGNGTDFHTTKESAIADCERRREEKIASLKKQIAKLEMMEFKL